MNWSEISGNARESFLTVNPYYLESIFRLSNKMEVRASRDIVDDHGIKLWGNGATVSASFQEKILQRRRVLIPLEVSLDVVCGVSLGTIVDACLELMKSSPALEALGGKIAARKVMSPLRNMPLPGSLKLLLTAAKVNNERGYSGSLARMIICSGLAEGLGMNDRDAVLLLLSALVCDIGELYINPAYLHGNRQLQAEEWKQVALHPRIGQAFLNELTDFPPAIADFVLQHHERQDGSGYPLQLSGANISTLGKLIGFADSVSAIVMRSESGRNSAAPYRGLSERVEIALRIVPEEFPPTAISLITQTLALVDDTVAPAISSSFAERVLPTLQQLRASRLQAEALLNTMPSEGLVSVGALALHTLRTLDKSLRATGVYEFSQLVVLESDPAIMGKTCLMLDEVSWRLRNLARCVYLRIEQGGDADELTQIADLVAVLNAPQEPPR